MKLLLVPEPEPEPVQQELELEQLVPELGLEQPARALEQRLVAPAVRLELA